MSYTIYESKVTTYYDGHCEDGEETPVYRDFDSAEEAVAQAKEAALRCLSHAVACPRRGDEGVEGAAGLGSELGLADAAGEERPTISSKHLSASLTFSSVVWSLQTTKYLLQDMDPLTPLGARGSVADVLGAVPDSLSLGIKGSVSDVWRVASDPLTPADVSDVRGSVANVRGSVSDSGPDPVTPRVRGSVGNVGWWAPVCCGHGPRGPVREGSGAMPT